MPYKATEARCHGLFCVAFPASGTALKLPGGRDRLVRHGHGPNARSRPGSAGERMRFSSAAPTQAARADPVDARDPMPMPLSMLSSKPMEREPTMRPDGGHGTGGRGGNAPGMPLVPM